MVNDCLGESVHVDHVSRVTFVESAVFSEDAARGVAGTMSPKCCFAKWGLLGDVGIFHSVFLHAFDGFSHGRFGAANAAKLLHERILAREANRNGG